MFEVNEESHVQLKYMKTIPALLIIGIILGIVVKDKLPALYHSEALQVTTQVVAHTPRVLTDVEIIANSKHPKQLAIIYTLESSQGKQDGCKRTGKYNGFGFRQNTREFVCYDTFQEVVNEVDEWLTEKDKKNYCLYNEGISRSDCPYAQTAMNLLDNKLE